MFQHILIPMDGSRLAESVLPAASYMASRLKAKVTLLHVLERVPPTSIHGDRHLSLQEEAEAYLESIATTFFPGLDSIEVHVHADPSADVTRSIVEHQDELAPDLVIMCRHGRGGLRDILFGSIAQQVIAMGRTPILLIQAQTAHALTPFHCHKILAPTDGETHHEQGVVIATKLGRICKSSVLVLSVVPTLMTVAGKSLSAARMMPSSTQIVLEMTEERLRTHLGQLLVRMQAQGLEVTAEVQRGDPTSRIIKTAGETGADVLVMATHGRAGANALLEGSVTAKVLARTMVPVLLVPL